LKISLAEPTPKPFAPPIIECLLLSPKVLLSMVDGAVYWFPIEIIGFKSYFIGVSF
jgi:hypothetical protein